MLKSITFVQSDDIVLINVPSTYIFIEPYVPLVSPFDTIVIFEYLNLSIVIASMEDIPDALNTCNAFIVIGVTKLLFKTS